jgi:phosphatidate cytidylyltransferase
VIITAYTLISAHIIGVSVNFIAMICIGLLSGILSQFGDLCASIIKRENDVKDFGNIMPGHGGVLDRFDSLLLVVPVVYFLFVYLPSIL